jgi:hypothetical protein
MTPLPRGATHPRFSTLQGQKSTLQRFFVDICEVNVYGGNESEEVDGQFVSSSGGHYFSGSVAEELKD